MLIEQACVPLGCKAKADKIRPSTVKYLIQYPTVQPLVCAALGELTSTRNQCQTVKPAETVRTLHATARGWGTLGAGRPRVSEPARSWRFIVQAMNRCSAIDFSGKQTVRLTQQVDVAVISTSARR